MSEDGSAHVKRLGKEVIDDLLKNVMIIVLAAFDQLIAKGAAISRYTD